MPPAAIAGDDPAKPKEEQNEPYPEAFRRRVDAAVDRGVEYLISKQRADGSWAARDERSSPTAEEALQNHKLGFTALMALACLKGGVKPGDASIRSAFRYLATIPIDEHAGTYDVGVLLMALHARYAPVEAGEVDRYGKLELEQPCEKTMTEADRAWMKRAVGFLLEHQSAGSWRYPAGGADLSNTQYALLGLQAAARCGIEIPDEVWFDALAWLRSMQSSSGRPVKLLVNEVRGTYRVAWTENARARGFTYLPGVPPVTGSMTTAGLAGLAICQDQLWDSRKLKPKQRQDIRRSVRDALAWMQDNFQTAKNPGHPTGGWHYYYLYGMERAGVLVRSRFMGRWDWYLEGATYLLGAQQGDGSWVTEHQDLDTAFAILFLKRSTARTRNPVITPR
jgi:hypothetical protein